MKNIRKSISDKLWSSCSRLLWSNTNKFVVDSVWIPVRNKIK